MIKLLFVSLFCCVTWQSQASDWRPWFSADGLVIAKRKTDTGIVEVKVSMQVAKSNSNALLALLDDVEQAGQWLPNVKSVTLVSHPVPSRHIVYTVFDAPFPITERQLLTSSCLSLNQHVGQSLYTLQVKGISDASLPAGIITIAPMWARWQFYESDDTLYITYHAFADPQGHVPNWLVNATTLDNTKKAFMALQRLLSDPHAKLHTTSYRPSACDDF